MLQANSIKTLSREACGPVLTEQDVQNIRQLGQRGDAFELISASLAPSVSPSLSIPTFLLSFSPPASLPPSLHYSLCTTSFIRRRYMATSSLRGAYCCCCSEEWSATWTQARTCAVTSTSSWSAIPPPPSRSCFASCCTLPLSLSAPPAVDPLV